MAETCETQDTLVSKSGVAKGMPDRAQILSNVCSALPPSLQKLRYSNKIVKHSIKAVSKNEYTVNRKCSRLNNFRGYPCPTKIKQVKNFQHY